MRKLVATEFVTLDGVMEAPGPDGSTPFAGWTVPYANHEFELFKMDELRAADVQLLGRVTYDDFARAWPERGDADEFSDKFNAMPKYVVSRTLTTTTWNNSHIIGADLATEIAKLKAGGDGDILIAGSDELVRSLMKLGLIDEYHLAVFPIVLGKGKRLWTEGIQAKLELTDSQTFATGVAVLTYIPAA
jgi:dihydrofolate reductase